MNFLKPLAAAAALAFALPAFAQDKPIVSDAFAITSSAAAQSGAAFMVISNPGAADDRLVAARSDIAERVELHTHLMDAQGVARMVEVKEGFAIPAGGTHTLARGADHVMFMGLKAPLEPGYTVAVTLVFENAGEVAVEIPVQAPGTAPAMDHGHGTMNHGG